MFKGSVKASVQTSIQEIEAFGNHIGKNDSSGINIHLRDFVTPVTQRHQQVNI